ncbi:MAG: M20/M25/M40 family metallo-hydrolase [Candidatus Acidiferrales bacterium]
MHLFELTRALVDIESITNHEEAVGSFVFEILSGLALRTGGRVERCGVEPHRFNVFAHWGNPVVTLSTHMDTVPPFFLSKEDDEFIWGRGSADAKGIIASMIGAAEKLLAASTQNFGLLFVVGEERNSAGAFAAARDPRGSRFLINGEPTENKLAIAAKGILRYEVETTGRLAHSAYPELGESAIDKLLDVLQDIRKIPLPQDELLGHSTLNVGVIAGGHAPNVVADSARAEIAIRLVDDGDATRDAVQQAVAGRAAARELVSNLPMRFGSLDGLASTIVAYTTDIPMFAGAWGQPYLLGPGSIHVAHTLEERVPKRELITAVEIYERMVKQLLAAS